MPKNNVLNFTGTVTEISDHKFLPDGAEVMTIVMEWYDDEYRQEAAVSLWAKKGFPEKFNKLEIQVGDKVMIPCQPSSKVKAGTGKNGDYRFWQTNWRGDSWKAEMVEASPRVPAAAPIEFGD